jgi:hypothetical protein
MKLFIKNRRATGALWDAMKFVSDIEFKFVTELANSCSVRDKAMKQELDLITNERLLDKYQL